MKVTKAETAGFCFGVNRAVDMTMELAKSGKKVATMGPLIHNRQAVEQLENLGVKTVICTDISRDGAMKGTNLTMYRELAQTYHIDLIASGGVSTLDDIRALREMELHGAIVGKAYYIGAIDLKEAIEVAT